MNKKHQMLLMATLFVGSISQAHAVVRSCDSSNHRVVGTIELSDGSQQREVSVSFNGVDAVKADGEHWRPPIARRRACTSASDRATSIMASQGNAELAKALCRANAPGKVILRVRPDYVAADAWHGDENNNYHRTVSQKWVACQREIKKFDDPVKYGANGTLLDWCSPWAQNCGRPTADKFCKDNGYSTVLNHGAMRHIRSGEMTRLFGNGQVCDDSGCGTFTSITCIR
jgi:hypothetical protein